MYPVEHFPVLIVGLALFCAYTMLLAGYMNRKLPFFMSLAMNSVFLIMSLFILNHVLPVGPIRYWQGGWRPPWGIENGLWVNPICFVSGSSSNIGKSFT